MPPPLSALQALKQGKPAPRTETGFDFGDIGEGALDLLGSATKPFVAAGGELLDILGRPGRSLSEAYGAYEAGKDPLGAAKRVLTGGLEKARYPTFGERILPEQEDEGVGRGIARFGLEVLTDPTTYLGPGLAKGLGRAAVTGTKAALGTKTAQAITGSTAGQNLARLLLPLSANVSKYGKKPGALAARLAGRAEENANLLIDPDRTAFLQMLRDLGLHSPKSKPVREEAAKLLTRGAFDPQSADPAHKLAAYMSQRFQSMGQAVKGFRDPFGEGIQIKMADGTKRPFELLPNYFPGMLKEDIVREAATPSGFREMQASLAKQLNITESEAGEILKAQTGRVKKAGHIEMARVREIPDELREWDPAVVFPRYVSQTYRRLARAREFGVEHQRLTKLLKGAEKAGLDAKTIRQFRNSIQQVYEPGNWGLENLAPKVLGFQVLTKMGPTSAVYNLSQHANTVVSEGLGNYVKGLGKMAADTGFRKRSVEAFHQGIRQQMEQLVGTDNVFGQGLIGRYVTPGRYLGAVGFNLTERGARMAGYAGGVAAAESKAAKALKAGKVITPELKAMGLTPKDVRFFGAQGYFLPQVERKIGLRSAKKTQFANDFLDLPPAWQTPEMRLAVQFKNFAYNQSRFLAQEVVRPAARYFETGGKEGSILPLARALTAFPVAGQGVMALRDLMAEQAADVIGAKRKRPRKFDYNHPIAQMAQDSLYVGALGMAGDLLQQAAQGRLAEFVMGPTASDVVSTIEWAARGPDTEDVARYAFQRLPGRRILPLSPSEVSGALRQWF